MGEKIYTVVYEMKEYPDAAVIRESICLDYQFKEWCFKGETYLHAKSYSFIPNNVIKQFMYWEWEIMRKCNLDGDQKETQK